MAVLSLDIGTTKICALVMDEESGAVLETWSADNTFLPAYHSWDRKQDPQRIFAVVEGLVAGLTGKYRAFRCIGVSGQMHGILYVDSSGMAVSPLYTWQDASASLAMESGNSPGETYAGYLAQFSDTPIAPGYGLATCFYHRSAGQIPVEAVKICTIGDYVAMRLCKSALPVMHATNAGGLGFFDLNSKDFNEKKLKHAGLDLSLLPRVVSGGEIMGEFSEQGTRSPVCVAIGDNQASFLGSVQDSQRSISINIGTGSQISLVSSGFSPTGALEARPFFEDLFLLVGASLCGGRSYAILENFFRQVLELAGFSGERSLYDAMDAVAVTAANAGVKPFEASPLVVNTLFAGSRTDPFVRGSILNITEDNFTPAQLISGFLNGAVQELYDFYEPLKSNAHGIVVGAGNGIRKNLPLQRVISQKFDMPLEIPVHQEEAAYGAALFALSCTGHFKTVFDAQRLVQYQKMTDFRKNRR